jgi:Domain of unknown function (DUF4279)
MKIRQHAHLVIGSEVLNPDQITASLLLEPDRVAWQGSRSTEPLIPRCNLWQLRARGNGTVDELVQELVDRIEALATQPKALTDDGVTWVEISLMRSFDDPDGENERFDRVDLPRQPREVAGAAPSLGVPPRHRNHASARFIGPFNRYR